MARRKKSNPKMRIFLKFFIIGTFACFFIYVIYSRAVYFFGNAEIFRIDEIVKSPSLQFVRSRYLDQLEGKNIFSVDLSGMQKRLQAEYPSIDQLRIIRQLPNRIIVTAEKRDPFAVVSVGSQDVVLDERGVVLSKDIASPGSLPYITGASDAVLTKEGKKLLSPRIRVALKIINEIVKNDYLKKFTIRSIDVGNLSKIYLHMNNIEIIMDRFKIEEKVETLGLLLSDAGVPLDQINYLDLRFKEPIINKK